MGITISRTDYAPLSLVSTILGFISFTFTLATLLKVFWSNLGTFSAAPQEIQDYLSGLKQGLLEERRHLRRVRRRLKSLRRGRSHGPGARSGGSDRDGGNAYGSGYGNGNGYGGGRRKSIGSRAGGHDGAGGSGGGGSRRSQMYFERDMQSMRSDGEDDALKSMRTIVKNLIKNFRDIEHPFLKPEFRNQNSAHWSASAASSHAPPYPVEKPRHVSRYQNENHSDDDSPAAQHMHSTNHLGQEYMDVGFKQRWLWVRRKAAVINLNEVLSKVEVRRTAHEVGAVLSMVCNIGRDLEDLRGSFEGVEGRLNRVVGVRRVD